MTGGITWSIASVAEDVVASVMLATAAAHLLLMVRWLFCCSALRRGLVRYLSRPQTQHHAVHGNKSAHTSATQMSHAHANIISMGVLIEVWEALGETILLVWCMQVMKHHNMGCTIMESASCKGATWEQSLVDILAGSPQAAMAATSEAGAGESSSGLAGSDSSLTQARAVILLILGQLSWHIHGCLKHFWSLGSNSGYDNLLHHTCTIISVVLAKPLGYQSAAVVALVLFGSTNPLMHVSKASHFFGVRSTIKKPLFYVFAVVYLVVRVVMVPVALIRNTMQYSYYGDAMGFWLWLSVNVMLLALYCLNLFWFSRILAMIMSSKLDQPVVIVEETAASSGQEKKESVDGLRVSPQTNRSKRRSHRQ